MKRTLLLALALAVIPVTVDAQVTELAQLRTLAEQGKARAQNDLGYMYATGAGVPEDAVLAYMWYNLAAAQGNERAQRNKDLLEERMTREQIAEGQRMSREWLEAHPPGGN
jgi:TPR repeat protein